MAKKAAKKPPSKTPGAKPKSVKAKSTSTNSKVKPTKSKVKPSSMAPARRDVAVKIARAERGRSKAGGARSKPAKGVKKLLAKKPAAKKPAAKAVATKVVKGAVKSVRAAMKGAGKKTAPEKTVTPPVRISVKSPAVVNGKPRKNPAGLSVRELQHFADLLLVKRREIVGDMSSMELEALRSGSGSNLSNLPVHMADMGTDNYEQEFTLGLVEKDRTLLREINNALAKITAGAYGICEGTGLPISKVRLEVQPWARYSIEFARQREKTGMGVRPF